MSSYKDHLVGNIGKGIYMAMCSIKYILHGVVPSLVDPPQMDHQESNTISLDDESDGEEMIEFDNPPSPLPLGRRSFPLMIL